MNKEILIDTNGKLRKRVCLTLDLINNPELIAEYKEYHSPEHHWAEIMQGVKQSGVTLMDIYLIDNRMFMICEVPAELDFDICWDEMGTYPRQDEWGELMKKFQQAIPGHNLEWVKMERVFTMK